MFTFLLLSLAFTLALCHKDKYYMTDVVKEHFINMLEEDDCTAAWPDAQNCVDWFIDTDAGLNYVISNDIPPYYVAPYCPFGVGKGYCINGTTTCPEFSGLVCPCQPGRENTTGDVETPQILLYGFPLNPNPTNATRPLNLYQLNPLEWFYDPAMKEEILVNNQNKRFIPFKEKDLFHLNKKKKLIIYHNKTNIMAPNPAYQTTGVHLGGLQIKGPADAEGISVDAAGIPVVCGGHVTPPTVNGHYVGPLYHYHKASFCLMESTIKDKKTKKEIKNDIELKISEEAIMSAFEKGIVNSTHSDLVGYANDGFGIYGFYDINGVKPIVDQCNGHFSCLDDKCNDVTYHYHAYNYTYIPPDTFYPYWVGCLGPSKGICNTTVHQQYDDGADWCGPGCGYQICVQDGTNNDTLNTYIASFGNPNWLDQFTVNPF